MFNIVSKGYSCPTIWLTYDISIWEEIRSDVKRKTDQLVEKLKGKIPGDISFNEFQGKQSIPWQLREVMKQRGNAWVQDVYDLCCQARKDTSKEPSPDFNRAVWAYWIEPFIMGTGQSTGRRYNMSPLLDLLFCAVGVFYEKRDSITVSQRDSCLSVRGSICETWYYKLHHRPSRLEEAAAALSRYNALERRAQRMAAGLPPEPPLNPVKVSTQMQPAVLKDPVVTAATWEAIEISFISDERVQIRNGARTETRNYKEFGFEDRRTGKPNEAWATLREMAKNNGTIRDAGNTGRMWSMVEKQVQNVRRLLRTHFGVTSDPIQFVTNVGYKARFKIGCSRSFDS